MKLLGKGGMKKGKKKKKEVRNRRVANYRRKFLVIRWIVLDGPSYSLYLYSTCPMQVNCIARSV